MNIDGAVPACIAGKFSVCRETEDALHRPTSQGVVAPIPLPQTLRIRIMYAIIRTLTQPYTGMLQNRGQQDLWQR